MALASTTVWELRTTGVASNLCGGGFNPANTGNSGGPGTDRSQSNTVFQHFTDLASTSASSWLVVTSASYSFVAADCGNLLYIPSGTNFTPGWYEILTVSGGAATLDRACGATSKASGGSWYLGGALSYGKIAPLKFNGGATNGNTVYIKAGTYNATSNNWNWFNTIEGNSTSLQSNIIGYHTTRGDNPTGANRPLINFTSAQFLSGTYCTWANLIVTSAINDSSGGTAYINSGHGAVYNCKFVNTCTAAAVPAFGIQDDIIFLGCEFVSYNGYGVDVSTSKNLICINCWFHDSNCGIFTSYTGGAIGFIAMGCIFSACNSAGISTAVGGIINSVSITNCTFFGGVGTPIGVGVSMPGTLNKMLSVMNCIFYGCTTGLTTNAGNLENYNNYFNNTTDVSGIAKGGNDLALNPNFLNVGQYTGTTATSASTTLTDSGANFANVVAGRDFLYVSASTGGNTGVFGITGKTTTTISTDNSLGTGSAITYSIIYGQNFGVGMNMVNVASPNTGNPNTITYLDLGAAQARPLAPPPSAADRVEAVSEKFIDTNHGLTVLLAGLIIAISLFSFIELLKFFREMRKEKDQVTEATMLNLKNSIENLTTQIATNISATHLLEERMRSLEEQLKEFDKSKVDVRRFFAAVKAVAGEDWPMVRQAILDDEVIS